MKRIKQKVLYFNEGNSDKVYEVDLCESGDDLFVVNFRYGRRGSTLRDGTKTVFPVGYQEAFEIYQNLIASKEKKGYSETLNDEEAVVEVSEEKEEENTARAETILKYLKQGNAGTYTRNWKLSRVIRRAGVLEVREAVPLIRSYLKSPNEFEQYSAIEVLSAFEDTEAVHEIYQIYQQKGIEDKVGRIALAYLCKFKLHNYYTESIRQIEQGLPGEVKDVLKSESVSELKGGIALYYANHGREIPDLLYRLYLVAFEKEKLKSVVVDLLNKVKLEINTFKGVRYIFRMAEHVNDLSVYGLVAKKLAIDPPGHYRNYFYENGRWTTLNEEMKKSNPSVAFSAKTQGYFIHRTYKKVYELSQRNVEAYIQLAMALLCQLDNEKDKVAPERKMDYTYDWENQKYQWFHKNFPRYSKFSAVMYILYGRSEEFNRSGKRWYYSGDSVGEKERKREEVLPEEWEKRPQAVLYVLAHAKSEEAIAFALRILKDNPQFLDEAGIELIHRFVGHHDPDIAVLMLNYLKEKYAETQPSANLVLDLLSAASGQVVDWAMAQIVKFESEYFSVANFLIKLLATGSMNALKLIKTIYTDSAKYPYQLTGESLKLLMDKTELSADYLESLAEIIRDTYLKDCFKNISQDEVTPLLDSENDSYIILAANITKQHDAWIYELFKNRVDDYIRSENSALRKLGIELLGQFPDTYLMENSRKIGYYYFSEYAEVRMAVQPAVSRLIYLDPDFKHGILNQSLRRLSEAESYDGLHESIYNLVSKEFEKELEKLDTDDVLNFLNTPYEYAQRIVMPVFRKRIVLPNFDIEQIVKMAKCDVREVRDFVKHYFERNVPRINYELEQALRIFNTEWTDVFDWSFDYFEREIQTQHWTTDVLLYVCDHTKENVQAFGRKMLVEHFADEKGLELLLSLQEHPSETMQFFATNYLNTYAKDNPEVILKLRHFVKTVLFRINTSRATKTRVFTFLEQEMQKDKSVAEMVVELINTILGTETQIDQSRSIDLLLGVSETYPDIHIPITVKEI